MPSVFLSYSREDLLLVEQLEAHLENHPEIAIWRDQERIYGGQKWPKVLGEAIADRDVFLLAWSKHSSVSHFVEFEWCTAIALKKTIIPCLLDDTPLAPSLKTFHGYRLNDVPGLIKSLRAVPQADVQRREPVIRTLSDITVTEETAVLAQAKTVFAQQYWTVQGNVYQAGGDIHLHNTVPLPQNVQEKNKPLIEKWQTWAGLAATLLTVISLTVDLPGKVGLSFFSTEDLEIEQLLAGSVQDTETNEPLAEANVTLTYQQGLTVTTNPGGYFEFRVRAPKQEIVAVTANKNGYFPGEPKKQILGNTKVTLLLKRQAP